MPILGITVTLLHLLLLLALSPLVAKIPGRDHKRQVNITYLDGEGVLRSVLATATEMGYATSILGSRSFTSDDGRGKVVLRARFRGRPPISELIIALTGVSGVQQVQGSRFDLDRDDEDDDED